MCEINALQYLDVKLSLFETPVIITGQKAYTAYTKHYPGNTYYPVFFYNQTASHEDMERLAKELPENVDCIIGIGGGKALDTAKGTANLLGIEYVTIPTVLGTCAAYASLSVVDQTNHKFKQVDYYDRAAYLCLVDLSLLVESPKQYFMGGIGDTLAKWYEAEGITEHLSKPLPIMVEVGLQIAKITQQVLLADSKEAISSLENHKVTPAFQRVAESILAVAVTVGGFAGEYGRMAGAHAVHNGLSFVPETHNYEHGVKVAYGVLVQLVAAGKLSEVYNLLPFYIENNFPYRLSEFDVKENLEEKMKAVAQFAASDLETFILAVPNATPDTVYQAMKY